MNVLLLFEAGEQEIELGLEGGTRSIAIEIREERIVYVLENLYSLKTPGQHLHQGGLSDPDRTVDGQVMDRKGIAGIRHDQAGTASRSMGL